VSGRKCLEFRSSQPVVYDKGPVPRFDAVDVQVGSTNLWIDRGSAVVMDAEAYREPGGPALRKLAAERKSPPTAQPVFALERRDRGA
jgi:hypothetical protein